MNQPDIEESRLIARQMYSEWRQSLSYGKHTYKEVATSIEDLIRRCHREIPHEDVKVSCVGQYAMMLARISEFTVGEMDSDDLPDMMLDPNVAQAGKCCVCGRPIAEYEEKFPVVLFSNLTETQQYECVDCNVKRESQ